METAIVDSLFDLFSRPGTYVLGISVYAATAMVRRIVETAVPSLRVTKANPEPTSALSRWWNKVILYVLPVLLGSLSCFINSEFLFGSITDRGGKVLFGFSIGWLSGFLYKCFKQAVKQRAGISVPSTDSIPPEVE